MKTELFEKLIRKIVREELEFYTTKILKEISNSSSKQVLENNDYIPKNTPIEKKDPTRLKESLSQYKQMLDAEYGNNSSQMQFDGVEVPPELNAVFNKNYSDFMKKLK